MLVTTPLRLVHMLREDRLSLHAVQMLCVDEADKLMEMGFLEQLDEVVAACTGPSVQYALLLRHTTPQVRQLANSVLRDPLNVSVGTPNSGASLIDQRLVFVGRESGKLLAFRQLVQEGLKPPVLVFLQSKERAAELFHELAFDGLSVAAVHADRTQAQRDDAIRRFRTGEVWVLICTDLMGRGLDFKGVNMVINYDFPQTAISYIHRIGRTGRAGRKGTAVTLFTEADLPRLRAIANVVKLSGCDVPDWMLAIRKLSVKERRQEEKHAPARPRISTVTGYDKRRATNKKKMFDASKKKKKQAGQQAQTPGGGGGNDE